ncbi:carbohydrate kinase [Cereibacter sp. SYSU M97828]|nr:carbohydrate kinase [Cereibacter flavus]
MDAGGTMVKVAAFDAAGREIGCEHQPNPMSFPEPGWTERDPERLWAIAAQAIRTMLDRTGINPVDVAAVTASGYGAGVFLLGGDGRPARPALGSTDSRALALIAEWQRSGVAEELALAVSQGVWPGQTSVLLGWFQQHEPEVMERTAHVMNCKDYLTWKLSGEISTDLTDAGCAGLMDLERGTYAEGALRAAGLGAWLSKLSPIGPAGEVVGHLTAEAARLTGLRRGTPVARGVYDVVGCSLASGLTRSDQLGIVAGTFSINSTLHPAPCLDPMPTLQCPYPGAPGHYLATIATPTSASNLEWLCRTMLAAEADRAQAAGRSIYEVCSELVAAGEGRESDAMFLPYLFGGPEGAPGALFGLTAGSNLGDVLRAVFEGIVFAHRADIDTLLGGRDSAHPRTALLAGGPSKSDVWSQMFCDAVGLPLTVAEGSEFGAKGAAICGAVAAGMAEDIPAAVAAMTQPCRAYHPKAERAPRLERQYGRYLRMSRELSAAWMPTAEATPSCFAGAQA